MANRDRPRGFEPSGPLLRVNEYLAVGSAIYPGELVKRHADGGVAVGTVSVACCGVAISVASSAGRSVMVADHPQQRFVIQADSTDIDAQTDIGLNYTCLVTGEDSTFRIARMEVDSSTGQVSAAIELRVIEIEKSSGNALGTNVDVIVQLNNHSFGGGTGAVGI